ncbi:hypothetical protein H6P81_007514 [Aristolochia fimbriata]|uniref:LTI65/LTI78 N-terminal domain-containing protein n=1 Tax=Aristolochia fimbriata TaxID=158543 RepID=A0AAV7F0H3_ARIFI|nr:hypothetical protein H6P81_007514 [Aristolochia fimbriata]
MAQMVRMVDGHAGERHSSAGREEMHGRLHSTMAPSLDKSFDHEEDHDHDHHAKKSVLAKVKEKARKWKQVLAKRRHGHDHDNSNATPAWGVSLDEDEELEDPYYHGAPMYETELVTDTYKDAPTHHETPPALSETEKRRMCLPESVTTGPATAAERRAEDFRMNRSKTLYETMAADRRSLLLGESSKTFTKSVSDISGTKSREDMITDASTNTDQNYKTTQGLASTVTQILGPAYAMVADATHLVASKSKQRPPPSPIRIIKQHRVWRQP